ncbi:MAG TPA: polysaccharide deacetylase family protein [Candidatus Ozemobacteraceae bacterium]|nr:polysaccharide deacetylase family protein [Candidatus Ozemobacteraceae bacterium]
MRYHFTALSLAILFVLAPLALAAQTSFPGIPGLCYHQVQPASGGKYSLSKEGFRGQLLLIRQLGYTPINSERLLEILRSPEPPREKHVVITFDDGYRSVFDHAFPIMREFGFVGVVCVYPEFIGTAGGMSWEQLRTLQKAGWSVDCHSSSHKDLGKPPTDAAARAAFYEREIVRPKQIIEQKLGTPVLFMAWPYGIYTEETLAMAKKAGYAGAYTVDGGGNYPGLDPFQVKRQVVYDTDTKDKFTIRLEMGSLKVEQHQPKPGAVLAGLNHVSCTLPELADYTPDQYVLTAKITGGSLTPSFDTQTRTLRATTNSAPGKGTRFIDIYLRDKRTGLTRQHGWFVIIK